MSAAVIEPQGGRRATSALIFMHGLGGKGDDMSWMAEHLSRALPETRFIFPTAPRRPITVNGGMEMNAWYDIASLDALYKQQDDVKGFEQSSDQLRLLVEQQLGTGAVKHVAVGGFSQGGAVSLFAALERQLHGVSAVLALSAYLPSRDKLAGRVRDSAVHPQGAGAVPPILVCHGKADTMVQYKYGKASAALLKELGVRTSFRSYRCARAKISKIIIRNMHTRTTCRYKSQSFVV